MDSNEKITTENDDSEPVRKRMRPGMSIRSSYILIESMKNFMFIIFYTKYMTCKIESR